MEIKKSHGTTPSMDYAAAGERVDGNSTTKLVRPNLSDFLSDVELAAKRALKTRPDLFAQFQAVYIDQVISVDALDRESLATITEQVARILVEKRIYPIRGYFAVKDLR